MRKKRANFLIIASIPINGEFITEQSAPDRFRTFGPHQWSADHTVQYHIFAIKESIPNESKNKTSQKFDFKYNFHASSNIY